MKETRLEEASEYFLRLTWAHWSSRVRAGSVRTTQRVPFGDVDYYEIIDGGLVRAEWTSVVYDPHDFKVGKAALNAIVSSDSRWSQPIVWGDGFYVDCEEDAVVLHRLEETHVYLALRNEGDDVPVRLCLDATLRPDAC